MLVDGGVALPVPEGVDIQDVLDRTLGPAIERLRRTWPNRMAYRAMWEQHPAFAGGITPDIERYVLADLVETDDGFRSSVSEEAVRFDGAELLTDDEIRSALDRRQEPLRIVRAELGVLATPPPLIPVEYETLYPQHAWTTVAGSNHYDVLIGDRVRRRWPMRSPPRSPPDRDEHERERGDRQPDHLRTSHPLPVEHRREQHRAGGVHGDDDGDDRQQPTPRGQQVEEVG